MRFQSISRLALSVVLACSASAHAAESAGKVLVAVGDVSVTRGGKDLRLSTGAPVEVGDTLKVGEASNAQVRFTDGGVVALRSNTVFGVTEYKFANKAESDKSVFSLLKGGLRTITGVIGHANHDNYQVKTETSTIGIRGTHYTLVTCNNDCGSADGKKAANGTYGGVTEGRISATNAAGEHVFGKDQYFHVASANSAPQMLLAPPSFLRDRMDAARAGKQQQAQQGQAAAQASTSGSSNSTSGDSSLVAATTPAMATVTALPPSTVQQGVINTAGGVGTPSSVAFTAAWAFYGSSQWNTMNVAADNISAPELPAALQQLSSLSEQGSSAAAANAHWGFVSAGFNDNTGIHWAYADPLVGVPTSGTADYHWVGGTTPTSSKGFVSGTVTTGGTLRMDFASRTVTTMTDLQYSITTNFGAGPSTNNYTVQLSNAPFNNTYTSTGVTVTNNNSCGGSGCTGRINGTLAGTGATTAILSVTTTPSSGLGSTWVTATTQVYKK
jgi:hypothetical protein